MGDCKHFCDGHCYSDEDPTSQLEDGSCESDGWDDGCNAYDNEEDE